MGGHGCPWDHVRAAEWRAALQLSVAERETVWLFDLAFWSSLWPFLPYVVAFDRKWDSTTARRSFNLQRGLEYHWYFIH